MKKMTEIDTLVLYHGNCHCGKYRFELKVPAISEGTECTCTQCFKKGYRWILPPKDAFLVTRDEGSMEEFNSGVLRDKVS